MEGHEAAEDSRFPTGRPAGQDNAALAGEHPVGPHGRAAAASLCAAGGQRTSTSFAARCRKIWPLTLGSVMNARIYIVPSPRGQSRGSAAKN